MLLTYITMRYPYKDTSCVTENIICLMSVNTITVRLTMHMMCNIRYRGTPHYTDWAQR